MARPDIDQVRKQELATTFRWNVRIDAPAGVRLPPVDFLCESSELPASTHAPLEINMRGHKIKLNGIWSHSDEISLELYETVDNDVSIFINEWRNRHWNMKDCSAEGSADIKTKVTLTRLDSTDKEIYRYTLFGVMLGGYTIPRLDNASEAFKPTIALAYDYFEEQDLTRGR